MPAATELPKKTKVPRSKMFEEEDIMTPESEAGYSPLLELMGKYDKSEENDERTKALKDLMQRYVISKSPAQARAETDVMNQEALLGAMSRAQSKLGTLGGKEAGSTLPAKDFGTVQPQLNKDLLKLLIDKPYGGIDPRLVQAARTEVKGNSSGNSLAERRFEYQQQKDEELAASKAEEKNQKMVEKYGNDIRKIGPVSSGIKDIEDVLGHSLDDLIFDIPNNKITLKSGEEFDPPGRNIWGLGRVGLDARGRQLNSAITGMMNYQINQLAGAAVSTGEMERIMKAFAAGRFNTETEQMEALARYKRALNRAIIEYKSKYPREVIETYEGRGRTWQTPQPTRQPAPSPATPPKQDEGIREITGPLKFRRKSTGRTYTVKPDDPRVQKMLQDPDIEMIGGSNAK